MARDKWLTLTVGDNIKVSPKPNAIPSAPIVCTYKGIKIFNGNVVAVVVDRDGLEQTYMLGYYTITKEV